MEAVCLHVNKELVYVLLLDFVIEHAIRCAYNADMRDEELLYLDNRLRNRKWSRVGVLVWSVPMTLLTKL